MKLHKYTVWLSSIFNWPNLKAMIVGVGICIFLMTSIEILLFAFHIGDSPIYRSYAKNYPTADNFGIVEPRPGKHRVRAEIKRSGEVLYDVTYSIDDFGRRITPVDNVVGRNKYALFFGCSFTYGEGVEDNQTLPYYFGSLATEYMPYNYGFHGMGPFDVLAKLETTDFAKEVKQNQGVIIYTFANFHVRRVFCPLSMSSWLARYQYYRIPETGRLIRMGRFESNFPFNIYRILSKSRLIRVTKIDIPFRFTIRHVEKTGRVIRELDYYIRKRLPGASFYVLCYPGSSRYARHLIPYLIEHNIGYLDYSKLFGAYHDQRFYLSSEDTHPSSYAYQILAKTLVKDLGLNSDLSIYKQRHGLQQ